MRLTIVPEDGAITIDGESYILDLSHMDPEIHAVQWYDTYGEIERKDPITKKMTSNQEISSIDEFQNIISAWQAEKDRIAALTVQQNTPIGNEPNVVID